MTGPLRYPAFRWLTAGRAINALGNTFAPIALAFAVLDLTGSATDLGLVVGARSVVNVAFLLFGGVLADRLPKRVLMIGASVAAAVTQGAVAALVLTGAATVPLLMLLGAVNGMVAALSLPASASLLPLTVPVSMRQQANAWNRLSLNTAAVLGAPVAGVVVAALGPGIGIAVDAATFAVSGLCFGLVRVSDPAEGRATEDRTGIVTDLRTGWVVFRSRTWLWVVVAGFGVLNAASVGGQAVLGPIVADETFGRRGWGLVLAAETVGMLLGALIAMRLRIRRFLLVGVACMGGAALPVLLLGVYPHLWALIVGGLVAGLLMEQFGIAWETTMQEHIPADRLARAYSYDMVGSFVAIPIGQVAVGPIAQEAGVRATLIGAAVLIVLAVIGMLSSRDVRTLRHELPEPVPDDVKESVP